MRVLCLVTAWPRYVERAEYLERSLASLRAHVACDGLEVSWVVTAETQGCDAVADNMMATSCDRHGFQLVRRTGNPSLGAHLTDTLRSVQLWDLLFYTQEDWLAIGRVPVSDAARVLDANPDVVAARLLLSNHKCDRRDLNEERRWTELLPSSEWFFAHNPYVARRDFITAMLPFPTREGHANGAAKQLVAERGWRFAALCTPYPFEHIGEIPAMTEKHAARRAARKASS